MPRGEGELENADAAAAHCPNCNAEYRAGFTHCADCGVELEPGPARASDGDADAWAAANERVWGSATPAGRSRPDHHELPIPIAELPWEEAWLLVGRLRSAGIEAFLYPPDPPSNSAYGTALQFGSPRRHQVLVYRADADDARAIAAEEPPA